MTKVNSLFVIAASIWDQWTLESSAAYLMLKSLSSGIGYHINPYRPRCLVEHLRDRLPSLKADAEQALVSLKARGDRGDVKKIEP